MRKVLSDYSGMISSEAAIVMSAVIVILTTAILFCLSVFVGISDICRGSVGYTGVLPAEIHRVTTVIVETGGDFVEKIA